SIFLRFCHKGTKFIPLFLTYRGFSGKEKLSENREQHDSKQEEEKHEFDGRNGSISWLGIGINW
ncbi:hypothetical protein, partial [uncultured Phocaeicola sp.]|uniref:hypothetical protein n=1 Tax=uncultured Phocaeicola sp. TaxID=990718 RepID=UPI0026269F35